MFKKKHVYMDMLPDGFGFSGGRFPVSNNVILPEKELSLQEQLKQFKEGEKPKEKSNGKFQLKL